jgi:hypothetical protein
MHMTSLVMNGSFVAPTVWHVYSTAATTPVTIVGGSNLNRLDLCGPDMSAIYRLDFRAVGPVVPYHVSFNTGMSPMDTIVSATGVSISEVPSFLVTFENVDEVDVTNYATNSVTNLSTFLVTLDGLTVAPGETVRWQG